MDIGSGKGYPSSALSNFSPHPFIFDGVECASMEGFLQSLKFKSAEMQVEVCKLVGKAAKFRGKPKKWFKTQILYWKGKEIKRDSQEYQLLIEQAYYQMYRDSESFRKALLASGDAVLKHSIGKNKINETVLTTREFCGILSALRVLAKLDKIS